MIEARGSPTYWSCNTTGTNSIQEKWNLIFGKVFPKHWGLQNDFDLFAENSPLQGSDKLDFDDMGYAMAIRQTHTKISPKVHDLVKEVFAEGQRTLCKKTFGEIGAFYLHLFPFIF